MKTKTKNITKRSHAHTSNSNAVVKELYNLLSDSSIISDDEREFWLANYSSLSEKAKVELLKVVQTAEAEFRKEEDQYMSRVAEINTKCLANLGRIAKANAKFIDVSKEEVMENRASADVLADEDLFARLREAGEI